MNTSSSTSDDEGTISLEFGGQFSIRKYIDGCTSDYYPKMNSKFTEILNIANSLAYTSFGIGGDVFTAESSIRNQTTSLTDFEDSFKIYYNDVEQMESNICSVLGRISGVNEGISSVTSSSIISPSGELVDSFKIQTLILKDPEELTDVEKQYLKYTKNNIGEDQYEAMKNVYTPEEANEYINSSILGMKTGKKGYFSNKISNIPKQITYKEGKYTYIYMLQKSPGPTFFGMELKSPDAIETKDGKTIDTNMYNYECVYTDEPEGPEVSYGIISFLPPKIGVPGNVAKVSGSGQPVNGVNTPKIVNGFEAKVNAGQQQKHIPDTNNYKNEIANGKIKSPMNGTVEDIQSLLDKKAGTGKMLGMNKERVDFGNIVGQYVDPITGIATDTTIGIIHYGKNGAHIVPARPK